MFSIEHISAGLAWLNKVGGVEALERVYGPLRGDKKEIFVPARFTRQEKRVLRKKRPIAVSAWAEKHRVLPKTARFSGKWRNSNVPYLAGIMDASFFGGVEEIIVCAAPQTGKTESVYTCLGYAADRKPGDAMVVFPSETDAKDNAKDRLAPMFNDSPRLKEYMTGYSDDMGSLKITLAHMRIYMGWSNSPGRLSNRPVMYAHADEEDKYGRTAGKKEASPVDLLKKRMRTFGGVRKLWRTSSPSVEDGSIWVALTQEAQLVFDYWVKCPSCGGFQKMVFGDKQTRGGICWPDGVRDALEVERTRQVWYQCAHCDAKWSDSDRDRAVRDGEWRDREHGMSLFVALRSKKPMRIGFHLPAWLSPFVGLWECAAAFLRGLADKTKLKDFQNGFAALPWKTVVSERAEVKILNLRDVRPAGIVPSGGVVSSLVAGVDTQDAGFWYEIRAFGYGMNPTSWSVRSGYIESFGNLARVLFKDVYQETCGHPWRVRLVCQDAMGHRTSDVYDFCRQYRGIVLPCKGFDKLAQPFRYANQEYYPGTKKSIPGGIILVHHDTNYFKNRLSSLLDVAPGDPGSFLYNTETTVEWARQMCAEGIDPETGLWINPGNRANHAMDCSVLCLLAAEILGLRYLQAPGESVARAKKDDAGKVNSSAMW